MSATHFKKTFSLSPSQYFEHRMDQLKPFITESYFNDKEGDLFFWCLIWYQDIVEQNGGILVDLPPFMYNKKEKINKNKFICLVERALFNVKQLEVFSMPVGFFNEEFRKAVYLELGNDKL